MFKKIQLTATLLCASTLMSATPENNITESKNNPVLLCRKNKLGEIACYNLFITWDKEKTGNEEKNGIEYYFGDRDCLQKTVEELERQGFKPTIIHQSELFSTWNRENTGTACNYGEDCLQKIVEELERQGFKPTIMHQSRNIDKQKQ